MKNPPNHPWAPGPRRDRLTPEQAKAKEDWLRDSRARERSLMGIAGVGHPGWRKQTAVPVIDPVDPIEAAE